MAKKDYTVENKLINEFLGVMEIPMATRNYEAAGKAIHFIQQIGYTFFTSSYNVGDKFVCTAAFVQREEPFEVIKLEKNPKEVIEATYDVVIKFIQQYNTNATV